MKAYEDIARVSPRFLDLSTSWRSVVSFMPPAALSQWKDPPPPKVTVG
jgi:hypothetical protein